VNSLRLWILILGITCFALGTAAGMLAAPWLAPVAAGAREAQPFADYERLLVERFDLSKERATGLRDLLAHYHADIERIKDAHMADYMSAMEPELRERGDLYRERIRDKVLPETARAEFDRLADNLPRQ
jgi:hypothetical protein